jgi:ACS family glucarate transporter-like MFS transporter
LANPAQKATPTEYRGLRWLLVFWLFVLSAVAYLDRVNISIAGQAIAKEFHFNNIQLGWLFSAFVLGYALFQAPMGRLADKVGARVALGLAVLWWAIFTSAITFVSPSIGSLIIVLIGIRFVLGIGEAIVYPASNCIVSAWVPTSERGIANGIIFAGVGFGAGLAPPIITYTLLHYGWRASFWVSATVGVVAGAVWYLIARDTPAQHPWTSQEEQEYIAAGLPINRKAKDAPQLGWGEIVKDRNVRALSFSYFTYGYAVYIFFSWFFIYLNTVRGLDMKKSSLYTMLPFIAMAIASPIGGWLSDRITRTKGKRAGRCGLAAVAMVFCGIFLAAGAEVSSVGLAVIVLAGGAGALYISQSSFWSVSADIGGASAGSVSGVMNMGCQLGGAISSSLTPWIAQRFGWTASFLFAAVLAMVGGAAWLLVYSNGRSSIGEILPNSIETVDMSNKMVARRSGPSATEDLLSRLSHDRSKL